MGNRVTVK